ncbi:hypothetical protein B0H12DRAFT_429721 [Mycena haematopus]|nr:hypothetical protein B0H12DRAFT_429721 [Mycena haematopus]
MWSTIPPHNPRRLPFSSESRVRVLPFKRLADSWLWSAVAAPWSRGTVQLDICGWAMRNRGCVHGSRCHRNSEGCFHASTSSGTSTPSRCSCRHSAYALRKPSNLEHALCSCLCCQPASRPPQLRRRRRECAEDKTPRMLREVEGRRALSWVRKGNHKAFVRAAFIASMNNNPTYLFLRLSLYGVY